MKGKWDGEINQDNESMSGARRRSGREKDGNLVSSKEENDSRAKIFLPSFRREGVLLRGRKLVRKKERGREKEEEKERERDQPEEETK